MEELAIWVEALPSNAAVGAVFAGCAPATIGAATKLPATIPRNVRRSIARRNESTPGCRTFLGRGGGSGDPIPADALVGACLAAPSVPGPGPGRRGSVWAPRGR